VEEGKKIKGKNIFVKSLVAWKWVEMGEQWKTKFSRRSY